MCGLPRKSRCSSGPSIPFSGSLLSVRKQGGRSPSTSRSIHYSVLPLPSGDVAPFNDAHSPTRGLEPCGADGFTSEFLRVQKSLLTLNKSEPELASVETQDLEQCASFVEKLADSEERRSSKHSAEHLSIDSKGLSRPSCSLQEEWDSGKPSLPPFPPPSTSQLRGGANQGDCQHSRPPELTTGGSAGPEACHKRAHS